MTSPGWPPVWSKQWKTLASRLTLKVRPRASPRCNGHGPRRCGPRPRPRQAQLIEDPGDGQLVFEMGKVEIGAVADGHGFDDAVGTGRGDHWWSRRNVRRVARGLVLR